MHREELKPWARSSADVVQPGAGAGICRPVTVQADQPYTIDDSRVKNPRSIGASGLNASPRTMSSDAPASGHASAPRSQTRKVGGGWLSWTTSSHLFWRAEALFRYSSTILSAPPPSWNSYGGHLRHQTLANSRNQCDSVKKSQDLGPLASRG